MNNRRLKAIHDQGAAPVPALDNQNEAIQPPFGIQVGVQKDGAVALMLPSETPGEVLTYNMNAVAARTLAIRLVVAAAVVEGEVSLPLANAAATK